MQSWNKLFSNAQFLLSHVLGGEITGHTCSEVFNYSSLCLLFFLSSLAGSL